MTPALFGAFAGAARRYWLGVFPRVRRELSHWRERAATIPDPALRALALDAHGKRGNVEGAAAFAAFAPRPQRAALVRAVVAFQAAYDYLDVLAEQPQPDPVAGTRRLHAALTHALEPTARSDRTIAPDQTIAPDRGGRQPRGDPRLDYYAHYPHREDGSYLCELVDTCRTALATLPSHTAVADALHRGAERIAEFQSLNLSLPQGGHGALERWARARTPARTDLRWWELAGAGGSPIGVYALLALAAEPAVHEREVERIEHAYHPSIGALHSLLDHLVDRAQDAAAGERNLIDYYASPPQAAARMRALAERAARSARSLPRGRRHAVLFAGMTGYYLSHPDSSSTAFALPIARDLRAALGVLAAPTLLVFKAHRLAGAVAGARIAQPRPSPRRREPPRAAPRRSQLRAPEQTALRPSP